VTRIISELRSEREDIEQDILTLERYDRLRTRAVEAAAQPVTEITKIKGPGDGSVTP
jgi:DNA repair exonuclease SbcCD ATPase subunit